MSMRVAIDDTDNGLAITLHASGGYAPDVVNDLTARAIASYKDVLAAKLATGVVFDAIDAADED